ncbi:F-box protein AFR [Trifolium pratense]|uniref:F-box protein AFR n=1 Tax=Trifolium pratense TaxID=57577 RepID=UPI001E691326|nr:F-box protein AFR [Trifolium pratense]
MATVEDVKEFKKEHQELIPGLPNEIAEICLLHVPYPYQPLVRSVSSSWNRAISNPSFTLSKKTLSNPHLFVLAFHTVTSKIQWQSLDPSSNRWFILPPMPLPNDTVCPTSFSCASLQRQGKIFVMRGTCSETETFIYRAAVNKWLKVSEMITGRKSFFAAEEVNGRIVTVGESGTDIYDPENDTWKRCSKFTGELDRYEMVVNGGKLYVTEGWWWPFAVRPRGWVYELENDTWREMGDGMKDGWTGVSVSVCGRVFMIPDVDLAMKVYDEVTDTWRCVGGERLPRERMKKPFVVRGLGDRIYVVSLGLKVVIGSVVVDDSDDVCGVKVTWQVLEGTEVFGEFAPSSCQVMYA